MASKDTLDHLKGAMTALLYTQALVEQSGLQPASTRAAARRVLREVDEDAARVYRLLGVATAAEVTAFGDTLRALALSDEFSDEPTVSQRLQAIIARGQDDLPTLH